MRIVPEAEPLRSPDQRHVHVVECDISHIFDRPEEGEHRHGLSELVLKVEVEGRWREQTYYRATVTAPNCKKCKGKPIQMLAACNFKMESDDGQA